MEADVPRSGVTVKNTRKNMPSTGYDGHEATDPTVRRACVQWLVQTIQHGLLVRVNESITPELAEERARNIATVVASELNWL